MAKKKAIEKVLGKSWLATLVGMAGAAAIIGVPLYTKGAVSSDQVVIALTAVGLGAAAKSYNVSGQ